MADIFISYRHGGTDKLVAGRLADRLARSFPVFFDERRESIDYGSSFPEEIDDALAECRVLLAVVGPDWLSVKNLSRLHSEKDWIRRELRTAIGRRIRIVPLLVKSDAPLDLSSLPSDLEPLAQRKAFPLDPDRFETDYRDLEDMVREWLSKRPSPGSSMPPDLPFLCDRRDQEDAFVDLVRGAGSSTGFIACVVHGHKWESHHELFDRFRGEGVLDDLFDCAEEGFAYHPLQLNWTHVKAGRSADALKSALKAYVLERRATSDSELATFFRTLARPLVVSVQFTWPDCQKNGASVVKSLVEAWKAFATTVPDGTVEQLPHPALLWINVTYDEPDYELPSDVLLSPLPKLCSVEEGHIWEWVALDRVKPYASPKKREILNLASDKRYYHAPGKLHMMHFADAVRDIIAVV